MKSITTYLCVTVFTACLLFSCGTSRSFAIDEVDEPPLAPLIASWNRPFPATADNRFLALLYYNLRYPKDARRLGIQAVFFADYRINAQGEIEDVKVGKVEMDDSYLKVSHETSDTLIINGFRVPQVQQSHGVYLPPPLPDFTYSDTLAGHQTLLREVERVIGLLPAFQPARRKGKPVAVRKITYFVFRMK